MPLNGTKIHPLTAHAKASLCALKEEPKPCQRINPGQLRRFADEKLIEIVDLPSPFMIHAGARIPHARLTDLGMERVAEIEAESAPPRPR